MYLSAVHNFETPWNQVETISTWITRLELLHQTCLVAGVDIDKACMVLTITSNAMKCPLFMQLYLENYNNLPSYSLANVKAYWVKKYKTHKHFNHDQSATNKYESAAFSMQAPTVTPPLIRNDYDTYVTALKEVIAKQLVDHKDAFTKYH